MAEYDKIAEAYQQATRRELRKFTLEPTLIHYLGELKGKRVLDLACGDGYSTRLCCDLGAKEVIGLDISQKEIMLAKDIESNQKNKRSIIYQVRDAAEDLSDLGKFDLVTGVMLLHYSKNKKIIQKMLNNVKYVLKSEGLFITTTPNPEIVFGYENYGVKMFAKTKKEGRPFKVTLSDFNGNEFCSFTNWYWKKSTYQELFEKTEFITEWHNSFVSSEGIQKYGKEFWKKFDEKPIYVLIKAKLK